MKKLFVWLLIATFFISIGFIGTGCKVQGTEETKTEETKTEEAKTETGEPKIIVWWSSYNEEEPVAPVFKKWVEEYKKIKPEITVDLSFAGREVLTKAMTARSGGTKIDIINVENYLLKVGIVDEGLSLVMNEALDTPNYKGDGPWKDSFISGTLEQYADDNENISIIPFSLQTNGFTYDKKLWRDNGWEVPKTWDEFLALCETIKTTSEIIPLTQDAGVDEYNAYWFIQIVERLLGPGKILAAASDKSGESWKDPAFKKAIEMERELWEKGYIVKDAAGFVWPAGQLLLANREASMELCGSWLARELQDQVAEDFEWGTFQFPEITGGVGKLDDMEALLIGWTAFNDTKVGPEIVDFLKFCTTPENQQLFVDATLTMSSIIGPSVPSAIKDLAEAVLNSKVKFSPLDGLNEKYADYYKNIFLKYHDQAFLGEISPDEFVDVMKNETIKYWENK